jgi:hypothetical protein
MAGTRQGECLNYIAHADYIADQIGFVAQIP